MVPVFPKTELLVDMPLTPLVALLLVEDATDYALVVPIEVDTLVPVVCGPFWSPC